ncbi:lytic transglycosylase domain-containing protein [Gemmobacter straminiformis]|uniref:Lytic transglycosylase domain-containing protein n=1 Tax=Paragemmobacter straminiformis TaxID=2045119 RepID=A0A842I5L5_9RHOB|nr:lytic transglycosylase domain-containing protein [Gemmobacter straminiformis]
MFRRAALGVVCVTLLAAQVLSAQEPPAKADFTFKRIRVGDSLPGKRITVQIDPVEQARLLALLPKVPQVKPDLPLPDAPDRPLGPLPQAAARYSWYWDTVPAGIDKADGRFALALATLGKGPKGEVVAAPRLQAMQQLAKDWGVELLKATVGTEVSPALALAVMATESGGVADAQSGAGAQGLMQLIPATAQRFGVADAFDPVQNIKGGIAYLDWLMKRFGRDPLMVIAAYNAGEGAVEANRGVPPYSETRDYVPKVLAAWQVAQGLCQSPPELVTDPCVFRVISASD